MHNLAVSFQSRLQFDVVQLAVAYVCVWGVCVYTCTLYIIVCVCVCVQNLIMITDQTNYCGMYACRDHEIYYRTGVYYTNHDIECLEIVMHEAQLLLS